MGTSAKGKAGPITGTLGRGFQPDWGNAGCPGRNSPRPPLEPEYLQGAAGHLHRDGFHDSKC